MLKLSSYVKCLPADGSSTLDYVTSPLYGGGGIVNGVHNLSKCAYALHNVIHLVYGLTVAHTNSIIMMINPV